MNTLEYYGAQRAPRTLPASVWLKVFCSHRARLQLARCATVGQGFTLLGILSFIAGLLSASPTRLHALLARLFDDKTPFLPPVELLLSGGLSAGKTTLIFTPLYFGLLCIVVTLSASAWTRFRGKRPWSKCFPAIAVGAVPLVWFFALIQLESVAPLLYGSITGTNFWNPLTNYVHFAVILIAIPLLGMWVADANRLYVGLDAPVPVTTSGPEKVERGVTAMVA